VDITAFELSEMEKPSHLPQREFQSEKVERRPPPSIDEILEKCGDFHRYQFMLLSFFCLVNVLASMHYYSQTIISFIPEHW